MTDGHSLPEDRPGPAEHAPHLRARVPDHVAHGAFSTGAIVVTGPNEFIIDFLQTIGRPHRVASRVIIPHAVMPQFIEALGKNLGLYRDRFGDPPSPPGSAGPATAIGATGTPQEPGHAADPDQVHPGSQRLVGGAAAALGSTDVLHGAPAQPSSPPVVGAGPGGAAPQPDPAAPGPASPPAVRRPTPQEIYDDLKIPDAVLSGAYANGVMIGHGASEFVLDFLTSFYPQSAVSARVFMGCGQIPRLLESLHHAVRQLQQQQRFQQGRRQPPQNPSPGSPDNPQGDEPF